MNLVTVISASLAVLGTVFLLILFNRFLAVNQADKLKRHRKTDEAVADKLIYSALVDDGICFGKNGAIMAAWLYEGSDGESTDPTEKNQKAKLINQALARLGSGWMIHVDCVRRPAPGYPSPGVSHFPDRITRLMDDERRELFERLGTMYEGYFVLTVTYLPPSIVQSKFTELMFEDSTTNSEPNKLASQILDGFRREIANLESHLSTVLKLYRLGGERVHREDGRVVISDSLLAHFHFCLTGLHQPILLPDTPNYLDGIIGGQELWGGIVPKIGDNFIQVVSIEGFPGETYPEILEVLSIMPCEYRWSTRFIFCDGYQAEAHWEKYRKKWRQKKRGLMDQVFNLPGPVDQDAVNMEADAEHALAEIRSGDVASGFYTSAIVLMAAGRDEVEKSARYVAKQIQGIGFAARIETINTMDAFFGSLPGHGVENLRRPMLNTANLSHLIPTSSIWTGEKTAPCPLYPPESPPLMYCVTNGRTPYRLNLHVGDVGHTSIMGPTGSGKSTLVTELVSQFFRYPDAQVWCFDVGNSLFALTDAAGGNHHDLMGDSSGLSFCPLHKLDSPGDRLWAADWIEKTLLLNGVQPSPNQRSRIAEALDRMNKVDTHSITDFLSQVSDAEVQDALKIYDVDGPHRILAAETESLDDCRFATFEMEKLIGMGERWLLPVLMYLFRQIHNSLRGQPTLIVLEEAGVLKRVPFFFNQFFEWLKVLRKQNAMVILSAQSMLDMKGGNGDHGDDAFLDLVISSTASKIWLANPFARQFGDIYRKAGLNDQQIDVIANAVPKRDYYHTTTKGNRLFQLDLGPVQRAFAGTSSVEDVGIIKALKRQHGSEWPDEWMKMRGISLPKTEGV